MPPFWEKNETKDSIYDEVERHSDGMISFAYHPPSKRRLQELRSTNTYRNLIEIAPNDVMAKIITPDDEKGPQRT